MFKLGLILGFWCWLALPGPLVAAAVENEQVTLSDLDDQDRFYIHGVFETTVPVEQVWHVLSDYEGLKGVISTLHESKVLERSANRAVVEQVMVGQFLFISRPVRLLLQVQEEPPWRIDFQAEGTKPFRFYEGAWQIEKTPTGCRVDYTLTVSRGDMAPTFIERKLFKDNSRGLLKELRAEVSKRAGQMDVLVKATPPVEASQRGL